MQLKKFKIDKAKMLRRLRRAALPISLALLFTACGNEQNDSLVLFEKENYNYKLIYSLEREDWEDKAIVEVYDGLEKLCGVAPELAADSETEETEESREILIGATNRTESQLPELGETDCYWGVVVKENKIIINGSNEHMIGLAVDYIMNLWNENALEGKLTASTEWTKEVIMRDFYREGWLLKDIPAYQGNNTLASAVYNTGTYLTEYGKQDAANNLMQSIWATNENELADYIDALKVNEYKEESHTSMENNQFYRFVKENQRVYVNYYGNANRATVELDDSGRPSIADISYTYEPKAGEETQYYMFGVKMDPYGYSLKQEKNTSGYIDNGACMIVKCADNTVIIIDGGATQQMGQEDCDRLYNLLCEITGKKKGEMIDVSAWYITHFDSDHTCGYSAALKTNPERYNLQRVICNLPDLEATSKTDATAIVDPNSSVKMLYPACQDIKVRTGDVIQLADVIIRVVFTHTDFADDAGRFNTTNFNTTSTVAMFENSAGMKMLVTGDMMAKAESVLCQNFSTETLKCDIFQQPHHNRTDVSTIYEYANAQVMFFTQAVGTLTENATDTARSELAKKWCSEWYCGGTETVGLNWVNGKANLIYQKQDIYN